MARSLRIAHLSATFPPYHAGAGNTCYRFALEQARRGHSVEVFTAAAEGEPPPSDGAIVHRLEPLLAIGNAPLIPQIARLRGFDVIHLHYPFIFGVELLLLNRLLRHEAALVAYYKNKLVGDRLRKPLFWAYEQVWPRILTRHADRVLVLSRAHGESVPYLRAAMESRPEQVVEMPNGVDVERFSPDPPGDGARAEFGVPDGAVMAVFCATLDRAHHFKRLDLAIEGLRLAGESDVHLVVAGDGELRSGYERQAAEAGLGDRVHFAGGVAHDRLPGLLRAADFFLFPTEPPESFGIVLIEAMASGLPVIASDYPGVRAVVDDEENGVLVPLGDAEAVASAIRRMVELGADGRRAMGAAGRAKCQRTWTWPQLTDRMDEVYRAAIETRRAKRGRR